MVSRDFKSRGEIYLEKAKSQDENLEILRDLEKFFQKSSFMLPTLFFRKFNIAYFFKNIKNIKKLIIKDLFFRFNNGKVHQVINFRTLRITSYFQNMLFRTP